MTPEQTITLDEAVAREDFETWCITEGIPTAKDDLGGYKYWSAQSHWIVWQAAIQHYIDRMPVTGVQTPKYLANGARFKTSEFPYGVCINGLPKELSGRWVALVAAEDNCHLATTPHPPIKESLLGDRVTDAEVLFALNAMGIPNFTGLVGKMKNVLQKVLNDHATTPQASPVNAGLLEALEDLLGDTQHKDHECGDTEYCPVIKARAAIAAAKAQGDKQ